MKYFISLQKPSLEKLNQYSNEYKWVKTDLVALSVKSDLSSSTQQLLSLRWRESSTTKAIEEVHHEISNNKRLISATIAALEHRLAILEHAQSILLIEDSPGFEKLFKSDKRSDHKRIIYITEKLIKNGQFVMLGRMLSSIDKNELNPKALGTLTRLLNSYKSSDKLSSALSKLALVEGEQDQVI